MEKKWIVPWSDKFVSGNKEIDGYHKEILDDVAKLYEMLTDSAKFKNEIAELTFKIEEALFVHMDIEIGHMKRFKLSGWKEHDKDHSYYKDRFDFYNKNVIPVVIRAVLTGEIALEYMNTHFFIFDTKDMPKINRKMKEVGENL
jgi:hemerythrin